MQHTKNELEQLKSLGNKIAFCKAYVAATYRS